MLVIFDKELENFQALVLPTPESKHRTPIDSPDLPTEKISMAHYDPKTIEERQAVAGECETTLQYGVRTYVDEMDNRVNDSYAAWPTRLYLIGLDGTVVYGGGLGPYDFKSAKLKKNH